MADKRFRIMGDGHFLGYLIIAKATEIIGVIMPVKIPVKQTGEKFMAGTDLEWQGSDPMIVHYRQSHLDADIISDLLERAEINPNDYKGFTLVPYENLSK